MRHTTTYAELEVDRATLDDIKERLTRAAVIDDFYDAADDAVIFGTVKLIAPPAVLHDAYCRATLTADEGQGPIIHQCHLPDEHAGRHQILYKEARSGGIKVDISWQ